MQLCASRDPGSSMSLLEVRVITMFWYWGLGFGGLGFWADCTWVESTNAKKNAQRAHNPTDKGCTCKS